MDATEDAQQSAAGPADGLSHLYWGPDLGGVWVLDNNTQTSQGQIHAYIASIDIEPPRFAEWHEQPDPIACDEDTFSRRRLCLCWYWRCASLTTPVFSPASMLWVCCSRLWKPVGFLMLLVAGHRLWALNSRLIC